jgi:hypothetical protein
MSTWAEILRAQRTQVALGAYGKTNDLKLLFASSTNRRRRLRPTDLAKTDEEMVYLFVEFGGQPRLQVESTDIRSVENQNCSSFFLYLVSSGFFVGCLCHLSLLVIRCT